MVLFTKAYMRISSPLPQVAALGRLHEFMKLENDAGGITRQEAVSMIPPLLLDVQPQHWVRRPAPYTAL